MANLETRIEKLEDQTGSADDLEAFFIALYTELQPHAPPPKFTNLPEMTVQQYMQSLQGKVLRPKILESNEIYEKSTISGELK